MLIADAKTEKLSKCVIKDGEIDERSKNFDSRQMQSASFESDLKSADHTSGFCDHEQLDTAFETFSKDTINELGSSEELSLRRMERPKGSSSCAGSFMTPKHRLGKAKMKSGWTRYPDDINSGTKEQSSSSWGALTNVKTPYLALLYFQLFVYFFITLSVLIMLAIFLWTLKCDIDNRVLMHTSNTLHQMQQCSREYQRNKCHIRQGSSNVPALEYACSEWEKCMRRDPTMVPRSRIAALVLGEIFSGFVDSLSWKTMTFLALIILGSGYMTNRTFSNIRNSTALCDPSKSKRPSLHHRKVEYIEETESLYSDVG